MMVGNKDEKYLQHLNGMLEQPHQKEYGLFSFKQMVAGANNKNCTLFDGAEIGSTKTIDLFALQCGYCN